MTDQALRRVDQLLTELVELVETARAVPMSASCVLPREHILDLLDDLRDVLPTEMDEARRIAAQRDTVIAEAHAHGERIREESDRNAANAFSEAGAQALAIRGEADQYADDVRTAADEYARDVRTAAYTQAQELIEGGRAEHLRMVTATGVHQAAVSIADRVRREADEYAATTRDETDRYAQAGAAQAAQAAAALRLDAERYAERTLSDLAEILNRAVATTEHGRQELLRRHSR